MRERLTRGIEGALVAITIALMAGLVIVVVLGVGFRKAGAALVWYDEVASILLAWLTFYGSALAALKRAHIGFPRLVEGMTLPWRRAMIVLSELLVVGFLVVIAYAGIQVFLVLGGDSLVGLPWVPQRLVQSAVPVGAVLFLIAEGLTLPDRLRAPDVVAVGGAEEDGG